MASERWEKYFLSYCQGSSQPALGVPGFPWVALREVYLSLSPLRQSAQASNTRPTLPETSLLCIHSSPPQLSPSRQDHWKPPVLCFESLEAPPSSTPADLPLSAPSLPSKLQIWVLHLFEEHRSSLNSQSFFSSSGCQWSPFSREEWSCKILKLTALRGSPQTCQWSECLQSHDHFCRASCHKVVSSNVLGRILQAKPMTLLRHVLWNHNCK